MPPLADRLFWPAAFLFATVILGFLYFGGAFTAEFSGAADEPSQFVTSLMVHDYIGLRPHPAPRPWAEQYYIHYPKVAFGHWPPGYHLLQSVWWFAFPPGRVSAMFLNAALALAASLLFYVLVRRIRPGWPAVAATLLLLAAPVTQQALAQTMAELPCLLCALCTLWSLTRLLERPDPRYLATLVVSIGAALLMKGTGVALVPGALLAVLASGIWKRLPARLVAGIILAISLPCIVFFLAQDHSSLRRLTMWAGVTFHIPWRIDILPDLGGAGLTALATAGAGLALWRRQPAGLAAAALLSGFILTSYFLRAIREPRLWIATLPFLLLLALTAYAWLERHSRWAPVAFLAISLPLFPFEFYRQRPLGFAALASQVSLPERMLISSPAGWTEGCWIAVVALREPRPASLILRATKNLVRTNWNTSFYELLASSPAAIEQILDESVVNIVVLHNAVTPAPLPHHSLLLRTMSQSESWRKCGEAGEVQAYCRAAAPRFPPKPIRIDLRQHTGEVIQENPDSVSK